MAARRFTSCSPRRTIRSRCACRPRSPATRFPSAISRCFSPIAFRAIPMTRSTRCCSTSSPTSWLHAPPVAGQCRAGGTRASRCWRREAGRSRIGRGCCSARWREWRTPRRSKPPSTAARNRAQLPTPSPARWCTTWCSATVSSWSRRRSQHVASGSDFETAFAAAAGVPLAQDVEGFWRRYLFWYRWLPFLTSGAALWASVTGLAILAGVRRRRRDAEIRRRWEAEEQLDQMADEPRETVN